MVLRADDGDLLGQRRVVRAARQAGGPRVRAAEPGRARPALALAASEITTQPLLYHLVATFRTLGVESTTTVLNFKISKY